MRKTFAELLEENRRATSVSPNRLVGVVETRQISMPVTRSNSSSNRGRKVAPTFADLLAENRAQNKSKNDSKNDIFWSESSLPQPDLSYQRNLREQANQQLTTSAYTTPRSSLSPKQRQEREFALRSPSPSSSLNGAIPTQRRSLSPKERQDRERHLSGRPNLSIDTNVP